MTSGKTVVFLGLGLVFWFAAAILIRQVGSLLFVDGWPLIGAFILTTLLSPVFIATAAWVTKTPLHQMLYPSALMLTAACLFDGAALTYVPALYGGEGPYLARGAAQILWGAGTVLLTAILFERWGTQRTT
ncbi:MAG: hypothetical protein ACE363_03075 [Alphaproteobacteria bacterium]